MFSFFSYIIPPASKSSGVEKIETKDNYQPSEEELKKGWFFSPNQFTVNPQFADFEIAFVVFSRITKNGTRRGYHRRRSLEG